MFLVLVFNPSFTFLQIGLMDFRLSWGTFVIEAGWVAGSCLKRKAILLCSYHRGGGYLVLILLSTWILIYTSLSSSQNWSGIRYLCCAVVSSNAAFLLLAALLIVRLLALYFFPFPSLFSHHFWGNYKHKLSSSTWLSTETAGRWHR